MSEECVLHRYLPEISMSWETLAIQDFCFWWQQMGNDHCFSGSGSLISCCLLSSSLSNIYKQGNREMFLLSCFSLFHVAPLLVALHRWVQSASWTWHHATENRLMRQRKWSSLFCREAGSDHLVVVKTDHTEQFCFVKAEFHSVLLHVYLISCKNCCPFLLPLDLLLFWNAKSPTVTLQQYQFTSSNESCDFDYVGAFIKGVQSKADKEMSLWFAAMPEKQKEMDGRDKENKIATTF